MQDIPFLIKVLETLPRDKPLETRDIYQVYKKLGGERSSTHIGYRLEVLFGAGILGLDGLSYKTKRLWTFYSGQPVCHLGHPMGDRQTCLVCEIDTKDVWVVEFQGQEVHLDSTPMTREEFKKLASKHFRNPEDYIIRPPLPSPRELTPDERKREALQNAIGTEPHDYGRPIRQ